MNVERSVLESRKSRTGVLYKKVALKKFGKFTKKYLCRSLFFKKVAGIRPETLLKKKLRHRCFPVNFSKFLRAPFFIELVRWLLLENLQMRQSHVLFFSLRSDGVH